MNRFLKVFLVFVMLGLHLVPPSGVDASEMDDQSFYDDDLKISAFSDDDFETSIYNEDKNDSEISAFIDDDSNLNEFDLDLASNEYYNETSDQSFPAVLGYVPEMLSAYDMLLYVEEVEIFEPITPRHAVPANIGSGLVQFVLEPVSSSLPAGVTMAEARAAAFNASTMIHPLFANATTNHVATAINGRFGRDAIFLGTSANGNRYRVMIGGFEGYVNRTGPLNACNGPCRITVPINHVNQTFEVRMNAIFVPFGNYPSADGSGVHSASHYVNRNGNLYRYLTNNAQTSGGFSRFVTGPAPSWMTQNTRYYSYDGVFFYRNPRNIRANGNGAVNANNPS